MVITRQGLPTFESAWARLTQECREELEMYRITYQTAIEQDDDECAYGCRRETTTYLTALRHMGILTSMERRLIRDYVLGKDGE